MISTTLPTPADLFVPACVHDCGACGRPSAFWIRPAGSRAYLCRDCADAWQRREQSRLEIVCRASLA